MRLSEIERLAKKFVDNPPEYDTNEYILALETVKLCKLVYNLNLAVHLMVEQLGLDVNEAKNK